MPLYHYQGSDRQGRPIQGLVAADSQSLAHQKLKTRGCYPTRIQEDIGGSGGRAGGEDLAYTTLQLSALLRSGIPMDEALGSLADSAETARMRRALARVRVRLQEGEGLAGALAEDEIFPPMLVRMVGAGEEAGQPGAILERYALFLQQELEHRRALTSALAYPVVLVTLSISLLIALLIFLTPVVEEMYASMGQELPALTQAMVTAGSLLRGWGLPLLGLLGLGATLILRTLPRLALDRARLQLPLAGPMLRSGLMSRWARTLGMLQGAGVPLVRALQMSREVVDNELLHRELRGLESAVERGEGLAQAAGRIHLIPPLLQQFLRTGERTGELEPMLESAARFYERELNRRRGALTGWLEPALILFMGVIVGLLVVSALLPLSQLATEL